MQPPVFVIGSPRSGTTLTLQLLAAHECFAWVSQYVDRNPHRLWLALANRVYDLPMAGGRLYRRGRKPPFPLTRLPVPVEPWGFWNAYLADFQWSRDSRTIPAGRTETDMRPEEVKRIRQAVATICSYQNKPRFLSKYTDFARIRYLTQAFPNAVFVHIVRDGRAAAHSYFQKTESGQFGSWAEREWWTAAWPAEWRAEWLELYGCALSFAAYQWKFFVDNIRADAAWLPDSQYVELRYEDLVKSPERTLRDVLDFCSLEVTEAVAANLNYVKLTNMNAKWRRELNDQQQQILENVIHEERFRQLFDPTRPASSCLDRPTFLVT